MILRAMRPQPRRRKWSLAFLVTCGLVWMALQVVSERSPLAKDSAFAYTPVVSSKTVIGSMAAIVLVMNYDDFRYIPPVVLSAPWSSAAIVAASLFIFMYEKFIGILLRLAGFEKLPSILGAMLSLFCILRATEKVLGRATGERLADMLAPGVNFLGKWMGLFLAPPLAGLDKAIAALPPYGVGVWINTLILLGIGWATTCLASAQVATQLAPKAASTADTAPPVAAGPPVGSRRSAISPEEALRRIWVLVAAVGYLGVAVAPANLTRPFGLVCELGTTVSAFMLAKLLPHSVQRVFHPLVVCALMANLSARYVGPVAPFLDDGHGVGDQLVGWLSAAVTGLGVRMFLTTKLWLDRSADFWCVIISCVASAGLTISFMALVGISPASPFSVPAPLSLPLLNRSVMSALGIEGSKAIGTECDPKLAVASILITGCIGASLAKTVLSKFRTVNTSSPLVRGIAMGCSAHSIGTAALIGDGDTDAAAISGAAMCLAGAFHTLILQAPGVIPAIRVLAGI